MFTGIITGLGRIVAVHSLGSSSLHGKRLTIETPAGYLNDVGMGDSIALNGACMTATSIDTTQNRFSIEISAESLDKTSGLDSANIINLEKALRANDRLGGHIVSGHVDGLGVVTHFAETGESWELRLRAPHALGKFLAYKGSITVNGVSLTVNRATDLPQNPPSDLPLESDQKNTGATAHETEISINLIAHTVQNTSLGQLKVGSVVNLEVDMIARYVERMLSHTPPNNRTA